VRHRDKPEVVHGESQERVAVRAGLLAEAGVVSTADRERFARIALSFVAEPGDPALGSLLNDCGPAEAFSAICDGHPPPMAGSARIPGLGRAIERWAARLDRVPTDSRLAAWERAGIRVLIPGDPEWPPQVDVLDAARPLVLWLRGNADLRFACLRSVSVVGARAASGYGNHVATEMAGALAERGWVVISGGAYGIDSSAHRGALCGGGVTVAVLASGLSYGYPKGHHELFAAIAGQGVMVSEWPPDRAPTRPGFLVRNRVIAALSCGTVVVEAALRSGALSTARHARDLCRPLMAVPGPVTSELSAGCHEIIREWGAVCVTRAQDVIEHVSPVGQGLEERRRGPARPRDGLDPVATAVLEAVPARTGSGPAAIAVTAGVDLNTAIQCLGALAAAGFVERCVRGWRLRKDA
jgi:DNA processing protein